MAPKRQPPPKPDHPVVFIKAASNFTHTPPAPDAVCGALKPLITVEKTGGAYNVSARFNLQINPDPLFHKMKVEDQRHAKFLDTILLEYRHEANEENKSDPSPGSTTTTFNVERVKGKKIEREAAVEATYPSPGAKVRVNVVDEQDIHVTSISKEWKQHVLENQDVKDNANPVKKPRLKFPFRIFGKPKSNTKPAKADDTADTTKAPNPSNPETTSRRSKYILMKWETTSSNMQMLHDEALDGTTQTVTITRKIPAKQFILRPDYKDGSKDKSEADIEAEMLAYAEKCFKFHFQVEIEVKVLGKGGFRASVDSLHAFRAPIKPQELYSVPGNAGESIEPRSSFAFTIGPDNLNIDTIKEIRTLLPTKDGNSQSVERTLGELRRRATAGELLPTTLAFVKHVIEDKKPKGVNTIPLMAHQAQSSGEDQPHDERLAIAFIGF